MVCSGLWYSISKDLVKFYVRAMDSTHLDGQLASLPGRYARTLFEMGAEKGADIKIHKDLDHFNGIYETVDNFKSLLLNPSVRAEEQQAIVEEIATKNQYDPLFVRFLCLLCENRWLNLFSNIYDIFNALVRHAKNIQEVNIISAIGLDENQQQKLQQLLTKKIASHLVFNYEVDPQVLGGFLIKIGCHVIDLTVINQLNMLATEMKGNA